MNNLYLILLAVAPSIALITFILLHDRYDKEPFSVLLKVFFFGMLATIPTLLAEMILQRFNIFAGIFGAAFQAFIVIGFTEEFFKRKVVTWQAFYHPAFNEKLDGIVYCSIASLGFATIENVFYVLSYAQIDPTIWLTRAFLSVPTHMLLGIIMGYYLGHAKFSPDPITYRSNFKKALVIPALLHGSFDFLLMANIPNYLFILIPLVAYLWVSGMVKLRRFHRDSKEQHFMR